MSENSNTKPNSNSPAKAAPTSTRTSKRESESMTVLHREPVQPELTGVRMETFLAEAAYEMALRAAIAEQRPYITEKEFAQLYELLTAAAIEYDEIMGLR